MVYSVCCGSLNKSESSPMPMTDLRDALLSEWEQKAAAMFLPNSRGKTHY